MPLDHV